MVFKEKSKCQGISLPFLENDELTKEDQQKLEDFFWLRLLRAGAMDVESAWQVLKNYLNMMQNNLIYFAKANPPSQLKFTYQQQVNSFR